MNAKTSLLLSCLLFSVTAAGAAEVPFDIANAPAPAFVCPIFDGPTDPTVMWNESRQEWWMLYTQRRANVSLRPTVPGAYGSAIGIAVSKNAGRSWYYKGTLDLPQPEFGHNTFWAPHVFKDGNTYHMIVTYIEGIRQHWEGSSILLHYKSSDMIAWELVSKIENSTYCIDASVYRMPDGTWKMWYRNPKGKTAAGFSKDLKKWALTPGEVEIAANGNQEAPVVFEWKGKFWNITDPCTHSYMGLKVYESDDGKKWNFNNEILNTPGKRRDDQDRGRHADVRIVGDRAYIFYFTHPGRKYNDKGVEIYENTQEHHRTSIQIAELEYVDGKIVCNRDKHAK